MNRRIDADSAIRESVPIDRLSQRSQDELLAASELYPVTAGQTIFTQGREDGFVHYLLDGEVELLWNGKRVKRIASSAKAARRALDPPGRKRHTVTALTNCTIGRIPRSELERQIELAHLTGVPKELEVSEIATEKSSNWMVRMLQSELFSNLPAANIQVIFGRMQEMSAVEDEVIVKQGESGDYYYVIEQGYCEVSREITHGSKSIHLADLGPGDAFGEAALIGDEPRNASVTMLSDGRLMRLSKIDFDELIRKPLLHDIDIAAALELINAGAEWLDIRYPEEYLRCGLVGSRNMPINMLRIQSDTLSREHPYIVCSDNTTQSAVGAFLLVERGFDIWYLSETVTDLLARIPSLRAATKTAASSGLKVVEFPGGSPFPAKPNEVNGMHDNEVPQDRLESTIDKIDRLYTEKGQSEQTCPPVPVEDYAQTATGKNLADLIEEMDEHRDSLHAPDGGLAGGKTPRYDEEAFVDLDPTKTEIEGPASWGNELSSVLFVDTRAPMDITRSADIASPSDEVTQIMRDFEQRVRTQIKLAVSTRAGAIEQRYEDRLERVRQKANTQMRDREAMLRQGYEARYKKKEQTLRDHYKKLMILAHKISEQKVQVQQARHQLEEKLHSANELYRRVEDMRRLLRDHLGGLEQRISRDMNR